MTFAPAKITAIVFAVSVLCASPAIASNYDIDRSHEPWVVTFHLSGMLHGHDCATGTSIDFNVSNGTQISVRSGQWFNMTIYTPYPSLTNLPELNRC